MFVLFGRQNFFDDVESVFYRCLLEFPVRIEESAVRPLVIFEALD